jgi:hypothetical protein
MKQVCQGGTQMQDRYLRIVLTVIALELFWIGIRDVAVPVSAQQAEATRVVITGIDIAPTAASQGAVPIMVRPADAAVRIQADRADRPLKVETDRPVAVTVDQPVKVEATRPLPVEQVPYTPGRIPGE